ncbi:MAG: class I SAM-dependent RNA methyltransferase [Elusimicrobia bacterium]|nr:class I SAM-dependent RNA methyltransferase [Elusimicrobiota bacterium]
MRCRHFGTCGGCSAQDRAYELQLQAKQSEFESLLGPLDVQPVAIAASTDQWYYRNKIELSFGAIVNSPQDQRSPALGFKQKGKWWKVFDLEECLIFDPGLGPVVRAVRQWVERENLAIYDNRRHQGFLRYLVMRKSTGGGLMVTIVTTSSGSLPKESFEAIFDHPRAALMWGIQDSSGDTAMTQRFEILRGEPFLYENLLGRRFRCGANSFFQTNPRAFELLLEDLAGQASAVIEPSASGPKPSILDLYCGVGAIGITLSERLGVPVLGIESSASSIEDAVFNAEKRGSFPASINLKGFSAGESPLNPVVERGPASTRGEPSGLVLGSGGKGDSPALNPSINFMLAKAEDVAGDLLSKPEYRDGLVILDPPRSGLHPKVLENLEKSPPKNLFYVCCNPKLALQTEFPRLCQIYKIVRAKAFDFFPQTPHYEALFVLRRRDSRPGSG